MKYRVVIWETLSASPLTLGGSVVADASYDLEFALEMAEAWVNTFPEDIVMLTEVPA